MIKNQYTVLKLMVVLLTLLLVVPAAHAADVSVGGGIGFEPDYEGSDYYEAVPVPYFNVNFNHGMFVKLLGTESESQPDSRKDVVSGAGVQLSGRA